MAHIYWRTDAQKVYFSGPMVRCNERNSDGVRRKKQSEWYDVWAQLGGTTLSVWDMKAIEEANKRGGQAPPSYINVTDAVGVTQFILCLLYVMLICLTSSFISSGRRSRLPARLDLQRRMITCSHLTLQGSIPCFSPVLTVQPWSHGSQHFAFPYGRKPVLRRYTQGTFSG